MPRIFSFSQQDEQHGALLNYFFQTCEAKIPAIRWDGILNMRVTHARTHARTCMLGISAFWSLSKSKFSHCKKIEMLNAEIKLWSPQSSYPNFKKRERNATRVFSFFHSFLLIELFILFVCSREYILDLLEGGHKFLVFAHHRDMLDAISQCLTKKVGQSLVSSQKISVFMSKAASRWKNQLLAFLRRVYERFYAFLFGN